MLHKGPFRLGDRVIWYPYTDEVGSHKDHFLVGTVTEIREEIEEGSYPGRLQESIYVEWDDYKGGWVADANYHKLIKLCGQKSTTTS